MYAFGERDSFLCVTYYSTIAQILLLKTLKGKKKTFINIVSKGDNLRKPTFSLFPHNVFCTICIISVPFDLLSAKVFNLDKSKILLLEKSYRQWSRAIGPSMIIFREVEP